MAVEVERMDRFVEVVDYYLDDGGFGDDEGIYIAVDDWVAVILSCREGCE